MADSGAPSARLGTFLIATVIVFITWPLLTGRATVVWDASLFFAPYHTLIADHARAGKLLLWNPWCNAGSPDFADPQVGAFSPISVLSGLLFGGTIRGFVLSWLTVWILGGVGMLRLARSVGAPAWGAAIVALGFALSGPFTGQAEHTSHVTSMAFLPWVVTGFDRALLERRLAHAFTAGAIWGLSALSGYPGLTILTAGFLLLWALVRGRGTWLFLAFAVTLLAGLAVMAPTYAAFFVEGTGFSERAGALPRETAVDENALDPGAIATVLSPALAMTKLSHPWVWPVTDPSLCSVWAGVAIPSLALLGFTIGRRAATERAGLGLIALLFLAGALGDALPVRGLLYDLAPPTRYFKHSAIFRDYFIFTLAVLAALSLRDLAGPDAKGRPWRRLGLIAGTLAAGAIVSQAPFHDLEIPTRTLLVALVAPITWLALAAIALAAARAPMDRRAPWLLVALAVTDAVAAGVTSRPYLMTANQAAVDVARRVDRWHEGTLRIPTLRRWTLESVENIGNAALPLKANVFHGYQPFFNRYHENMAASTLLSALSEGAARFYFSPAAAWAAPSKAVYGCFVHRTSVTRAFPIVLHTRQDMRHVPERSAAGPDDAHQCAEVELLPRSRAIEPTLLSYEPCELSFKVEVQTPGWLVVTDRWARGWRATVDGERAEVLCADFVYRAVALPGGRSVVRFTYHPYGYPGLVVASWTTLGVALWISVRSRNRVR